MPDVNGVPMLWVGTGGWAVLAFALVPLGQGLTPLRYALVAAGVGLWGWVLWTTGTLAGAAAFFEPWGRAGWLVPVVLMVLPTIPAARPRRPADWLPPLAAAIPVLAVTNARFATDLIGPWGASDASAHVMALGALGLYVGWAVLDGGHRIARRCALAAAALLTLVGAAHALRVAGVAVEDLHLVIVGAPLLLVLDQAGVFGARPRRQGREAVQHGW